VEIDNSAANCWRDCPLKYYESYVRKHKSDSKTKGIQSIANPTTDTYSPLSFGTRWHELMEERNKKKELYEASPIEKLEQEAQRCLQGYEKHWGPEEDIKVIDVERLCRVPLPDSPHTYIFKADLLFERPDGTLKLRDYKSQKRGSSSNDPKKWAADDQGTLYLWGVREYYKKQVAGMEIDICVRPSPAGLLPPTFPDRYELERTNDQIAIAVRDIIYVADQIEAMHKKYGDDLWPANRKNCFGGSQFGQCEFYLPHTYGWSDEILEQRFEPKSDYLGLGKELTVIQ
jgi:hypothetical protein